MKAMNYTEYSRPPKYDSGNKSYYKITNKIYNIEKPSIDYQ